MSHVVLLGDSIFDNASYVPGSPPVIKQVKTGLPAGWQATRVALDGDVVASIAEQMQRIPETATHLVVSIGGNDALQAGGILMERATSVGQGLAVVAEALAEFHTAYSQMLTQLLALKKPLTVCTIYDAVPGLGAPERAALAGFNDVITRSAIGAGIPLIDLRVLCNEARDYSSISPIEPSEIGGAKIANAICRVVTTHDFATPYCVVYK
jgi:hypothetical protein